MKTKYIAPAVNVTGMATEQIMVDLSYDDQEGDGNQLSKMTPFVEPEPEEKGDVADEYFKNATKPHWEFKDIWADD
ncbi:MAG: hypothetical protein IJK46_00345 [Prevotella sp.]|nr:hypothetical protein [Prevotella sp.]